MRIIGGIYKGVTLHIPKDKSTRPLKDMARESIFNLLAHSTKISFKIEKSNVLDLYAGSGSFGLECLSRNSQNVSFVEKQKNAIEILEKNISKLKIHKQTNIFFNDVFDLVENRKDNDPKFDLIFCDPPFKDNNTNQLIKLLFNKNFLQQEGIIILHRNKETEDKFPNCFKIIDERKYGISKIIFGKFLP